MRVAVINDMHANGGAVALLTHRYTLALQEAGHQATLITGKNKDPLPDDVPVESWDYPSRHGASFFEQLNFYKKLKARSADAFGRWFAATDNKADLWVAMVPPSALGALDAGGRRIPLLYMCNSPWAQEWLSAYRCTANREPGFIQKLIGTLPRRRSERRVVRRATGWMALSQTQLDWMGAEHPGARPREKEIIAGAVDTDAFTPLTQDQRQEVRNSRGFSAGDRFLICSRRLVPRTGIDMLIEALPACPDNTRLVVTGDGPDRQRLEGIARESGLGECVTFTGFLPPDELKSLTAAADLAVLPTRELEGFGLSAAEAMSAGTPVVATPVGGLVELVGGLESKLLTDEVSAASLARTLCRALGDARVADADLRLRCREYIVEKYDWRRWKDRFVALCERSAAPTGKWD